MKFKIGNYLIDKDSPAFIVAELSTNHRQNFEIAVATIKAAKTAGANAIKLQTYTPDTITLDCDNKYFQIRQDTIWDGKTLYKLYQEAYTPWDWQPKLKKVAQALGLICFSSPFDKTAVDFLERMAVPAYKIASFEITDIPLIEYVATKGKPIIISTGIAIKADIKEAVQACRRGGNNQIALLKCTSSYPTPLDEVNLKTIPDMQRQFKTIVGLSDHTLGISVPIASIALGAKIIEKHLILDRKLKGPDATFSLEPEEFKQMVNAIRETEKSLGKVTYKLSSKLKKSRQLARSLFAIKDINKEETLTEQNVKSIRPAFGLPSKYLNKILGRSVKRNIKRGTPIKWSLIN